MALPKKRLNRWRRVSKKHGPEELRRSRDDREQWIADRESRQENILEEAREIGREIDSRTDLDVNPPGRVVRLVAYSVTGSSNLPLRNPRTDADGSSLGSGFERSEVFAKADYGQQRRIRTLKKQYRKLEREVIGYEADRRAINHILDNLWSGSPVGEGTEDKVSEATVRVASKTQLRHLKTAREVLQDHPEIDTKDGFEEKCDKQGDPGGSVRRRVQELGKERLDMVHLPSQYTGFSGGFQQLVKDLCTDSLGE